MMATALLACTLTTADAAYVQEALNGWTTIARELLALPDEPLPWMVLYSRTCAFHVAPDRATPLGRSTQAVAEARLTFAGRPVEVSALPVAADVELPNGARIPAAGLAFTNLYERDGVARAFFVTALPDVWAHDPKYADDPEDWAPFVLKVLSHELVHTRQIVAISNRLEALQKEFPVLAQDVNDDWLQAKFEKVPGLDATVRAEVALLHQSATETDPARGRELARLAIGLIRARRVTYYPEPAAAYSRMEDVFLNMEGVACWAAFRFWLGQQLGITPDRALDSFRGNRKFWSQEEGLALFLALERFVPDWKKKVFPPELATPLDLLEQAVR
jgi:hypothetical protein